MAPVSRWRHSRSFTVAVTHAAALALAIMQWPAMSAAVLLETPRRTRLMSTWIAAPARGGRERRPELVERLLADAASPTAV